MPDIAWNPHDHKPQNADAIDAEIERVALGATVRLTLAGEAWRVRALLPAALCSRGASASERDVSDKVREVLLDHGCKVEGVTP